MWVVFLLVFPSCNPTQLQVETNTPSPQPTPLFSVAKKHHSTPRNKASRVRVSCNTSEVPVPSLAGVAGVAVSPVGSKSRGCDYGLVDGTPEIRLNKLTQLIIWYRYLIICEVLYIPGGAGFVPSRVIPLPEVIPSLRGELLLRQFPQKNWGQRSDSKITTKHFRRYFHPNHQEGCRFGLESKLPNPGFTNIEIQLGTKCGGFVSENVYRGQICNLDQVQKSPPQKKNTQSHNPHIIPQQQKTPKVPQLHQTNNLKATYTELPMDSKNSLVVFSPTPFEKICASQNCFKIFPNFSGEH